MKEKEICIFQVDSFTNKKFKGNPAGVVLNADLLSEVEMQNIARELNNSETAFILSPESNNHDIRIRYFTPVVEVPICGHATIAAHYVRAVCMNLEPSVILSQTGAGILPVEIKKNNGDYSIIMTQGKIEFFSPLEKNFCDEIMEALGITNDDRNHACPIQIVSTGHSKVMIGINSREKLNNLTPNLIKLIDISNKINCNGYFIFTINTDDSPILTHGRMFAPAIGINEDPVTGNANGPLGAYLVYHNLIKHNNVSVTFCAEQGHALKRSGTMTVNVDIKNGKPQKVRIEGEATIVFNATFKIKI